MMKKKIFLGAVFLLAILDVYGVVVNESVKDVTLGQMSVVDEHSVGSPEMSIFASGDGESLRSSSAYVHDLFESQYMPTIEAAVSLIDKNEFAMAIKKLDDVLKAEPENAAGYALKGFVFAKTKKLNDAEEMFKKALQYEQGDAELHAYLASILLQKSQRKESEAEAFAALKIDNNQPQALIVLAKLHEELGQFSKAIELHQFAIKSLKERKLNHVPATASLAALLNRAGIYGGSHEVLKPVILEASKEGNMPSPFVAMLFTEASLQTGALDDALLGIQILENSFSAQSLEAQVLRARYLFAIDEQEKSIALLESIISKSKENKSMPRLALFNLLKKSDQVEKAANVLEMAVRDERNVELKAVMLRDFANYLFIEQRGERVLALAQEVADENPLDLQIGFLLASSQKYQGQDIDALKTLNKLIKIEPRFASAYALKGDIFKNQEKYNEAISALRSALEIDSGRIDAWVSLAYVVHLSKGHEGLLSILNEGLEKNPENIELLLEVAAVYDEENKREKANKIYQSILTRNKNNVSALMQIAFNIASSDKEKYKALPFIEKAKELSPVNPRVLAGYGWVLHLIGDDEHAIISLREAAKELPDSGQLCYWTGVTLMDLNKTVEAESMLRRSLMLGLNTSEKKQAQLLLSKLDK